MKTIVETQVIPPDPEPEIIETTWYVCEDPGCEFRTQDEDAMKTHHGRNHSVQEFKALTLDSGSQSFPALSTAHPKTPPAVLRGCA